LDAWREARAVKLGLGNQKVAKRYLKIATGFTLLSVGVILLVTPGPGWLTILFALSVLAAEFVWARRLLDHVKKQGGRLREAVLPSDRSRGV
jgi:uncharacterized protein (TIGR02611 family)